MVFPLYNRNKLTNGNKTTFFNATIITLNMWNADGTATPAQMGGGDGLWSTTSPVWTDASASITAAMTPQPGFAIFGGTPGAVTIDNSFGQTSALGMQFLVDGYLLTGNVLQLDNGGDPSIISVGPSANFTTTITNSLTGNNGINKTGTGILVLSGTNTYIGTTILTAGVLSVSANNNLGAAPNSLDFEGGILESTAPFTMDRTTTLGAAGGTFLTDSGTVLTQNGIISGLGTLNKTGLGTLVLNDAANNYNGGTTVNDGTLQAGVAGALVNNTNYTINAGTLDLNNFDLIMSSLVGSGGSIDAGTATLTVNQTTDTDYAGTILGSNLFVKSGAGRLEGTGTVGNTTVSGTIAPGGPGEIAH
ncbi:MAG: autotransporter-associated beta strand repeat-containing protein [Legionella sp.]|uniref:autotransporter-associated beta strand repeat-containing protein n=1 Tax=Legionella sp. TaxID=459 RepID=UPI0039E3481F